MKAGIGNEDPKPLCCIPTILNVLLNFSACVSPRRVTRRVSRPRRVSRWVSRRRVSHRRVSHPRVSPRSVARRVSPRGVARRVSPRRVSPALRIW